MRSPLAPLRPQETIHAFQRFFDSPLDDMLDRHRREDPEAHVLSLFHAAAASVPAYQSFLADHGVDPAKVCTFADFKSLPLTTKQNYLAAHPLASLCRLGRLLACDMIAVSSGSTGKPGFGPRSVADELARVRFERVFHGNRGGPQVHARSYALRGNVVGRLRRRAAGTSGRAIRSPS
jgi:phenylacetate-CoA ligase